MKRLIITLLLAALALCPQPLEAGSGAARVRGVASAPVDMSYLEARIFRFSSEARNIRPFR